MHFALASLLLVASGALALYTPTNSYGMITRWFLPGYDEMYVKFHVMFEEGFEHGPHFLTVAGNRIDNNTSSFGKAGVKQIDMQNMRWRTTTDNWMPTGAAPKTQYIWGDDVTVWRP